MNKNNKQITFVLLCGVALVQIIGLLLPFTGDAGKYAAISKNIFLDHDFLNLKIHGSPYYQKPPFLMWLSSAGYFLFGTANNFTTRLFPVLFSLLMPYATFRLAKLFYHSGTAKTAALFMATTQIYFLYNTDLHTDVVLATCTSVAIWQLAEYILKNKWLNFLIGFIFIALAVLTKGPVGAAVPVFAIGSHLLLNKKFKAIFRLEWLGGLLIVLIIIFPYLRMLYANFGWDGPIFFFWTNNAGRVSGSYRSNNNDYAYYLYNLLVFTLPWSLFYIGGLIRQTLSLFRKKHEKPSEYYTIGGSIIFLIILSFSKMKSPNYFYPVIPLLSILAADYFQRIAENQLKLSRFIPIGIFVQNLLGWGVAFLIVFYIFPLGEVLTWIVITLLFGLFVIESFKSITNKRKLITASLATIVALNLIVNSHLLPELFNYQSSLKAADIYNQQATSDDRFYTYRYAQFELFFYAKTAGYKIKDEGSTEDPVTLTLDVALETGGAWYLIDEYSYQEILRHSIGIEKRYRFDNYYLTDINWTFLNPKTRASVVKNTYLIKTKN